METCRTGKTCHENKDLQSCYTEDLARQSRNQIVGNDGHKKHDKTQKVFVHSCAFCGYPLSFTTQNLLEKQESRGLLCRDRDVGIEKSEG